MIVETASLIGFFAGFSLLAVCSRLVKSFSFEYGLDFFSLVHIPRFPKGKYLLNRIMFKKLWRKFLCFSLLYGIGLAAVYAFLFSFLESEQAIWLAAMVWVCALLGLIDRQVWLLPDFLTIPLLIGGFFAAFYVQPLVTLEESLWGAAFGYLMPLIVASAMKYYSESPIGGGDVKALAALGAWFGVFWLNFMLVASFIIFAFFVIKNQSRVGPYGPAMALAAILTVIAKIIYDY